MLPLVMKKEAVNKFSLVILADSVTTVTMADIDWTIARWYPGEGYENYTKGLIASKESSYFLFPI